MVGSRSFPAAFRPSPIFSVAHSLISVAAFSTYHGWFQNFCVMVRCFELKSYIFFQRLPIHTNICTAAFFERQSGLDIVLKFKKKSMRKKPLNEMFSLMTSCVTVHRKMRW